jgi:hypothetical protein
MRNRITKLRFVVTFAVGFLLACVTSDAVFAQNRGTTVRRGTTAARQQRPNIVVIMGDDIGMWNIGAYHRGLM